MAIYRPMERSAKNVINCPLCGASILKSQRKCEHCGSIIEPEKPANAVVDAVDPSQPGSPGESLGMAMIALPVVGTILAILWVARINVLDDPFTKLAIVALSVVALTAILGIIETITTPPESGRKLYGLECCGPISWLVLLTVGWPAGFPLYHKARTARGRRNQFKAAAIAMIVFVAALVGTAMHIQKHRSFLMAQATEMEKQEQQAATAAKAVTPAPPAASVETSAETQPAAAEKASAEITPAPIEALVASPLPLTPTPVATPQQIAAPVSTVATVVPSAPAATPTPANQPPPIAMPTEGLPIPTPVAIPSTPSSPSTGDADAESKTAPAASEEPPN